MAILAGAILAWSPSITNTTSMGLGPSFDFRSDAAPLVPSVPGELVAAASVLVPGAGDLVFEAVAFVPGGSQAPPLGAPFFSFFFRLLVVTLPPGTLPTFVREL